MGCKGFEGDAGGGGAGVASSSPSSGTSTADGSTSSAGGAGTGGAAPVVETIAVVDPAGTPVAGAVVIANDAAGALLDQSVTGADGKTTLDIPPGGSVSYVDDVHRAVSTIVAPPQGGTTTIVDSILSGANPSAIAAKARWGAPLPGKAASIRYFFECDDFVETNIQPGNFASFPNYRACPGSTTFSVWALAEDISAKPVGFGYVEGIPIAEGADTGNITLSNAALQTVSILDSALPTSNLLTIVIAASKHSHGYFSQNTLYPSPSNIHATGERFPSSPAFDRYSVKQNLQFEDGGFAGHDVYADTFPRSLMWSDPLPSAPFMPIADDFGAQVTLHYSLSPDGTPGQLLLLDSSQDDGGGGERFWRVVLPAQSEGTVTMVTLPAEMSDLSFEPQQTFTQVQDIRVDTSETYEDLVSSGFAVTPQPALMSKSLTYSGRNYTFDPP